VKECEAKLKQSHNILIIVELDFSKKCAQFVTAPNKKPMLDTLQADIMSFIASKIPAAPKPVSKEIKFKDKVIGALLTSRTKHLSLIEQTGNVLSVDVQPDQSQPNEFVLRLTGVNVRAVELTIESIVKRLEATVIHAQLLVDGHNVSITSTDPFRSFCSQLLQELHVHCMYYPPVGGDLLRQVHLRSKAGNIITLQIAIGQLSEERVDAIVVPAESCDKTMTNVEMRFEYFKFSETKSLAVGEVACIDSGSFPSRKALHVALPKRRGLVEKQACVDFVAACVNALDCATNNHFGSLSFPALGVDSVHNVSGSVCANTLLYSIDKYYCQDKSATLHTIRIVVTQDLSSAFLSCFDEHSFENLYQNERSTSSDSAAGSSASSSPRYEWYWEDDKKQFTQYSQSVSDALTAAKLENPDKRCYIQICGKSYLVDLVTMTQKNVTSRYVRKVMCKEVSSVSSSKAKVQWYYRDDKKNFAAYSQVDSAKIEDMYQKVSGAGTVLRIQTQIYTFDFENKKQVNFSTKNQRDIKREETPFKESKEAEQGTEESSQCVINLRGPQENLETAKQKVKDKLKFLSAFKNVPLPPASTPALKQKLFSIARRHSVSSFIRDDEKPKLPGVSSRRFSQVIRIEGAEHLVDKAVTEVQGEIIEFQSLSSSTSAAQADTHCQYPSEWEAQTSTSQLFKLDRYSQEWTRIISKFQETMPDSDIISVQRIQNKWLWERYSQHKERIREKNDGAVNEKELWHGSSRSSSDNIYNSEEGFDMRFSLKGLWGLANYFAEKASYSDKYAFTFPDRTKELLLAKVVTGDSFECIPDPTLRMPPEKPKNKKTGTVQLKQLRYDSVTGTTSNCRVYMTYSNDKAYPAYLITYSTTPKPSYKVPPPSTQTLLARLQAQYSGFTQ
jgi:O-acetyl-ADP-ribose deacetylase (regulator of RNase III)